jgi:hypothetical protein
MIQLAVVVSLSADTTSARFHLSFFHKTNQKSELFLWFLARHLLIVIVEMFLKGSGCAFVCIFKKIDE